MMSERRKPPNAGKGRKLGVPNRVTQDVRAAFKLLLEGNVERVQGWINRVARKDPARALTILLDMAEFCLPRLARTEVTGENGAPLNFLLTVPPKADQQSTENC